MKIIIPRAMQIQKKYIYINLKEIAQTVILFCCFKLIKKTIFRHFFSVSYSLFLFHVYYILRNLSMHILQTHEKILNILYLNSTPRFFILLFISVIIIINYYFFFSYASRVLIFSLVFSNITMYRVNYIYNMDSVLQKKIMLEIAT